LIWYTVTLMYLLYATYGFLFISLFFEVFLLVAFLERNFIKRGVRINASQPQRLPAVCIVVPCYNEGQTLTATIGSLLALQYPADKLEIAIVDDGSTDDTLTIARQFESDSRVKVFAKDNGGKHTAMNLALQHTNAEFIGCLDADSTVAPDALMRVVPLFADEKIAAVTPGIHVREQKNILQKMQHVEYRLSIFNRFMLAGLGSTFITPGPFSIFRTAVVRELGGWRYAHSTEDMEMALRIQLAGHLIANQPQAIVHTKTPETFRGLFRQRVRWTYGWLRNAVDYRFMFGNFRFGNLGIIVLPSAILSIGAGIFFFFRILWNVFSALSHELVRYQAGAGVPHMSFDAFYLPTSALWFLVWASVFLILALISAGSLIGTGSRKPPASTPLFMLFYSFLVPLWLIAAVFRATFKTGVRWR
jgi:cellulose synthase/poly-beta-1,6-N-acetylglucosamine synthase-like glycosyltransferase